MEGPDTSMYTMSGANRPPSTSSNGIDDRARTFHGLQGSFDPPEEAQESSSRSSKPEDNCKTPLGTAPAKQAIDTDFWFPCLVTFRDAYSLGPIRALGSFLGLYRPRWYWKTIWLHGQFSQAQLKHEIFDRFVRDLVSGKVRERMECVYYHVKFVDGSKILRLERLDGDFSAALEMLKSRRGKHGIEVAMVEKTLKEREPRLQLPVDFA